MCSSSVDVNAVFDVFRKNPELSFIPVVNELDEPKGIILEKTIKDYAFSPYGMSLLRHKGLDVNKFIGGCPVVEVSNSLDSILEVFSMAESAEGVLVAKEGKYAGFLSAKSILRIMYNKKLDVARDSNPLSKLPGNSLINDYINTALCVSEESYILSYFDFDNFKPFNDLHGFRKGDQAILLFAGILKEMGGDEAFVGHIGGDDFFVGFREGAPSFSKAYDQLKNATLRFSREVSALYTAEERKRGFITSKDREGNTKLFPLLGVSVAVVNVPRGQRTCNIEDIGYILATLKKDAKQAEGRMAFATLGAETTNDGVTSHPSPTSPLKEAVI
jgi:GGDEF domain-containing protein